MRVIYPDDLKSEAERAAYKRGWSDRAVMSAKVAGSATSEAKAIAVRMNGARGGRPRKPSPLLTFGVLNKTRFPVLKYQSQGEGNWRYVWTEDGAERNVGPAHPTRDALLADLDRFASSCGL